MPARLTSTCRPSRKRSCCNTALTRTSPPQCSSNSQTCGLHPPAIAAGGTVRDLRSRLWSSIDNDTSRDLDQIEVAEQLPNGDVKVLVGIADLDAFVAQAERHRSTCRPRNHHGLRRNPKLPHAPGGTFNGQDFPAGKSGPAERGHRICGRRRRPCNHQRRLPRVGSQPSATAIQLRGSVARRHGCGAAESGGLRRSAGPTSPAG